MERLVQVGDRLGPVMLFHADGEPVELARLLDRPVVVPLVRYYGCMPCKAFLHELEPSWTATARSGFCTGARPLATAHPSSGSSKPRTRWPEATGADSANTIHQLCLARSVSRFSERGHRTYGRRRLASRCPALVGREWRSMSVQAVWSGAVLAESDQTIVMEGNHYFPPESVNREYFHPSSGKSLCPWKGVASYYSITVDGATPPDAAWYYPHPSPLARKIKNRVAFWNDVQIIAHDSAGTGRERGGR